MTIIDITDLAAVTTAAVSDTFPVVQGGVTKKETLNQVITLFNSNIQITEGQVTNLTVDLASKVPLAGGTMTGLLILSGDPTNALGAATKQYVDNLLENNHEACVVATTANLTAVYNNGSSGVGATLTNSGALAAFSSDGVSPALNSRILVKNQTNQFENGIYTLTVVGDGATAWVLTRATDFDQTGEIDAGDIVGVINGNTFPKTQFMQYETVSVIGTDNVNFTLLPNPANSYSFTNVTDSTSATTGAITTAGGIGITKKLNAGDTIQVVKASGDAQFQVSTNAGSSIYSVGVDDSTTNDDLVICQGNSLGTNNIISIDGSSLITDFSSAGITLPTSGGTATEFKFYQEIGHTTTWSGIWAAPQNGNGNITRIGNEVRVHFPTVTAVSTVATIITMDTALPSQFRPSATVYCLILTETTTATQIAGWAQVANTGVITIMPLNATFSFESLGTEGFYAFSIGWLV